jgi:hypothetical protein
LISSDHLHYSKHAPEGGATAAHFRRVTRTELHGFVDSTKRRRFEQALKHLTRFSSENGIEILLSDLDTGEP